MGLSARQVLMVLFNQQANAASATEDVKDLNYKKQNIEGENNNTNTQLNDKNSEAKLLKEQNRIQTDQLQEYHELLSETIENEDPMKQMYCGIKEFVIEEAGMCGMGMGMGSLQLNSNLQLTGAELLAMNEVLNDNSDGQLGACGLVERLHQMGIENAQVSESGDSIELTRVDENGNETKVTFKDANGDGMLNGCDYDFSDALCKFNEDLKAYNEKIDKLEKEIEISAKALATTQEKQEKVDTFIDYLESIKDKQEKAIKIINGEIDATEAEIKEVTTKIEDLKTQYDQKVKEEKAEKEKAKEEEKAEKNNETEKENEKIISTNDKNNILKEDEEEV